jgi:hypothetical protein
MSLEDTYKYINKTYVPYARGFVNFTGAACWLNSMVQAVLGCDVINELAVNEKETYLAKIYSIVVEQYSSLDSDKTYRLTDILTNLSKNKSVVQNVNNQNDPTEFIQLFIEGLGHKINDKCVHTMKSTIKCNNHEHIKRDNGVLVPVALTHMEDVIQYLKYHEESIEYKCDKPNVAESSNPIKKRIFNLSHASEVLIVMVKNYLYNNDQVKNINYPRRLVLAKKGGGKWVYTVMSVVEHHGMKDVNHLIMSRGGGGHYTCTSIRKNKDGSLGIYNLNDSSTTQVNDFPNTPNVCLIVYKRHQEE